jgi:hypothetical protein
MDAREVSNFVHSVLLLCDFRLECYFPIDICFISNYFQQTPPMTTTSLAEARTFRRQEKSPWKSTIKAKPRRRRQAGALEVDAREVSNFVHLVLLLYDFQLECCFPIDICFISNYFQQTPPRTTTRLAEARTARRQTKPPWRSTRLMAKAAAGARTRRTRAAREDGCRPVPTIRIASAETAPEGKRRAGRIDY